jgi:predicted glycoside hydrolase/deacetylase ChbG (UPF0249 family)
VSAPERDQRGDTRLLIVNADDFGQSAGINEGVLRAFDDGIVTSASLMIRWPAATSAAAAAAARPGLSVGLHLDFGEWEFDDGEWRARYAVEGLSDDRLVRAEAERQLHRFRKLVGRDPTHIDSHQHVHTRAPYERPIRDLAAALRIPLRRRNGPVGYRGEFYGQSGRGEPFPDGISLEALLSIMRDLPPGITELGCHPAAFADMGGMYAAERLTELAVLCDQRLCAALRTLDIGLTSFGDVAGWMRSPAGA